MIVMTRPVGSQSNERPGLSRVSCSKSARTAAVSAQAEMDEHPADRQLRRQCDVARHQRRRPFVPPGRVLEAADEAEEDGVAQDPGRILRDELVGELPQPDDRVSRPSGPVEVPHRCHDEPERGIGVAGGQVVAHGRRDVAGGPFGLRRSAMQRGEVVGPAQLELVEDEVPEELMEANGLILGVERNQREPAPEQTSQERLPVGGTGHRGAARAIDVVQQRQGQHGIAFVVGQPVEDLGDDVVEEHPVRPQHLAQEPGRIVAIRQREPGELRVPPAQPSVRAIRNSASASLSTRTSKPSRRSLASACRQRERLLTDLAEQPPDSPTGQRQVRIAPRDQDRSEPRR